MFVKRLFLWLTVCFAVLLSATVCFAESEAVLSQAYVWEQDLDVFITGDMNPDDLSCKVSNQAVKIVESGLLANKGVTIRTTILIDVSASMPPAVRGNVKAYIDGLIQNISDDNQYKIVTFCEQMSVLQDFTGDRYDLSNAASSIEFHGQQSKIYDAVYNTIPKMQPLDGAPCYYRTIVITDGLDDTASGVTKEELYLKLQADKYPIDVVLVTNKKQGEPAKELSALTRMSGGQYRELNQDTDIVSLTSEFSYRDIYWVRAKLSGALLDGSIRQVNLGDGAKSVQFDMKIPVLDTPVDETLGSAQPTTTIEQPEELSTSEEEVSETKSSAAALTSPADQGLSKTNHWLKIGAAGIASAVMIGLVFAVLLFPTQKRKGSSTRDVSDEEETVLIPDPFARKSNEIFLRFQNTKDKAQVWDVILRNELLIGRDKNCQIHISDTSVSHKQCKIYMDTTVMIENLSKSNITRVNGIPFNDPVELKAGDQIKCGRILLDVDFLDAGELNKGTIFINI